MLGLRHGRGLFLSSPRLEGGWFHRLWQTGQPGDADVASFQFATWDSPYWDPKEVEQARAVLPGITFRREYGAEFVSASGALIKREDIRIGAPTGPLPVTMHAFRTPESAPPLAHPLTHSRVQVDTANPAGVAF